MATWPLAFAVSRSATPTSWISKVKDGEELPRYERPLILEVWYPAATGTGSEGTHEGVFLRDGVTKVQLKGRAVRDA